jgi:3-hydroxyisobutyrate dehydrogenase-like beta-hydroxyacid dehydrogenase
VDAARPLQLREALFGCDAAFTMFGSDDEFAQALQAPHDSFPRLIVDFSPVSPSILKRAHGELTLAGVELIGVHSAAGATGRLYADSSLQSHTDILVVLRRAAKEVHFTGSCGTSKAMATLEQLIFAVSCAASKEAISLATRAGLDANVTRELLAKGSGANEVLATGGGCSSTQSVQAIARGQELARSHEHALPLCAAAKALHQWERARA